MSGRGWGFKLDYAKEIAADLATIADVEHCLERGWIKPADIAGGRAYGLADHVLASTANAATLEMTDEDRACLADTLDYSEEAFDRLGLQKVEPTGDWYRRGDALAKRINAATGWSSDLLSREALTRWRKKARADLARHRRNQTKYGEVSR